jgi:3-oxoacyl-[acyl-carrier protein] reductase
MDPLLDLTGRVTLITGAGQGVGRQVALFMASHGAKVVVNDYFLERAEVVAAEINNSGAAGIAVQTDVTEFVSVTGMVGRADEEFGAVDILVNNAGNAGPNASPFGQPPFWETGQRRIRFCDVAMLLDVLNP